MNRGDTMSKELLEKEYYFDKEGKKDMFYDMSYYCLLTCAYEIAKNQTNRADELIYSLIDDLSLFIILNEKNKIKEIFTNSIEEMQYNYIVNDYKEENEAAIPLLQSLLDSGEAVIVHTITELLDFSINYTLGYNIEEFEPGHVFLILHYDEENYYYLEDPFAQINYDYFIPYKGRKDIGVMAKDKMNEIFKHYLRCHTISFNWDQEDLLQTRVKATIEESIKSYSKPEETLETGNVQYTGRAAICKLMELSEGEGIDLNAGVEGESVNLLGFLPWLFSILDKKRRLLALGLQLLVKQEKVMGVDERLFEALKKSEKLWVKCKNLIEKNKIRGKERFDSTYSSILKEILEVEDVLNELLENTEFIGCSN